jgi:hypothetical protein
MQEIWLPVLGYEGLYEVSNMGEVRSLDRIVPHFEETFLRKIKARKLLKTFDKQGRNYVTFSKNGKTNKVRVHIIVATHFIGERPKGLDICHNDGNPSNNCVTNLRYDTKKANMKDMICHGNSQRGERNYNTIATTEQIFKIRRLRKDGLIYKDICIQVGLSFDLVAKVCQGRSWKWLS